jgi:hypothetical protein
VRSIAPSIANDHGLGGGARHRTTHLRITGEPRGRAAAPKLAKRQLATMRR